MPGCVQYCLSDGVSGCSEADGICPLLNCTGYMPPCQNFCNCWFHQGSVVYLGWEQGWSRHFRTSSCYLKGIQPSFNTVLPRCRKTSILKSVLDSFWAFACSSITKVYKSPTKFEEMHPQFSVLYQ